MKTGILGILGGMILLACMIFAIARFDSADRWVHMWLPFVIVGVAMTVIGVVTGRQRGRLLN